MSCKHLEDYLAAYVFDELEALKREQYEAHLATCAECREALQEMRATTQLLDEALTALPLRELGADRREAIGRLTAADSAETRHAPLATAAPDGVGPVADSAKHQSRIRQFPWLKTLGLAASFLLLTTGLAILFLPTLSRRAGVADRSVMAQKSLQEEPSLEIISNVADAPSPDTFARAFPGEGQTGGKRERATRDRKTSALKSTRLAKPQSPKPQIPMLADRWDSTAGAAPEAETLREDHELSQRRPASRIKAKRHLPQINASTMPSAKGGRLGGVAASAPLPQQVPQELDKSESITFGMTATMEPAKELKRAEFKDDAMIDADETAKSARKSRSQRPSAVSVNPFVMTAKDRLSTFAIDTDTASYIQARTYILNRRQLPPANMVRVEEFVNVFDYNYTSQSRQTFSVQSMAAPSPFRPGLTLLKLGIRGKVLGRDGRKPRHLVLVVDTSGSMGKMDRLPLVKIALTSLVSQLDGRDRVSLVTYGAQPNLLLEAHTASDRQGVLAAIASLQGGGTTNLLDGLHLGYETASRAFRTGEVNRVILCSDGVANIGDVDAAAILQRVARYRHQGISLTCAGFGTGAYNDALMEQLANRGDGSYIFVDSAEEANRVFAGSLAGSLQYIAKDVKIQVEFNPRRVRRYRLLGYENRDIADRDFRNDAVDAGEVGSGQSVTALYELELTDQDDATQRQQDDLATAYVRYRNMDTGEIEEIASRCRTSAGQRPTPENAPRFYLAACAAEFAEILRGSEYVRDSNLPQVERILEKCVQQLPLDTQARELLHVLRRAQGLPR
jgi:Ca-activated chloride channel family protein